MFQNNIFKTWINKYIVHFRQCMDTPDDEELKKVRAKFIQITANALLPSLSLIRCNPGMVEELWAMISLMPYEERYPVVHHRNCSCSCACMLCVRMSEIFRCVYTSEWLRAPSVYVRACLRRSSGHDLPHALRGELLWYTIVRATCSYACVPCVRKNEIFRSTYTSDLLGAPTYVFNSLKCAGMLEEGLWAMISLMHYEERHHVVDRCTCSYIHMLVCLVCVWMRSFDVSTPLTDFGLLCMFLIVWLGICWGMLEEELWAMLSHALRGELWRLSVGFLIQSGPKYQVQILAMHILLVWLGEKFDLSCQPLVKSKENDAVSLFDSGYQSYLLIALWLGLHFYRNSKYAKKPGKSSVRLRTVCVAWRTIAHVHIFVYR